MQVSRVGAAAERGGDRFTRRILAPKEIEKRPKDVAPAVWLAERFAVKEACLKALGSGWASGVAFNQVVAGEDGKLELGGPARALADRLGVVDAHVALMTEGDVVAALVVLEG